MKQETTDNNFTSHEHLIMRNKDYKEHSFRRPSKMHSIRSFSSHHHLLLQPSVKPSFLRWTSWLPIRAIGLVMPHLIASEASNWGLINTPTAPGTKGSRNRHFHCFVNFSNGISRTISWSLSPRSAWRYCWNRQRIWPPILACIACRTTLKKPWPGITRLSSHYLQDDQVIQSLLLIEHGSPA